MQQTYADDAALLALDLLILALLPYEAKLEGESRGEAKNMSDIE